MYMILLPVLWYFEGENLALFCYLRAAKLSVSDYGHL